jgi:G3E family GTPase
MDRVRQSVDRRTSIHLLTGFLGSGKTSLLQHYLRTPSGADTAVLINEFGEIGLDHRLVAAGTAGVQLVEGGCLCCAVSGVLGESLRALLAERKRTADHPFSDLVIETAGLAYPEPILNTIRSDYALNEYLRIGTVVTVVDAVTAEQSFARHPEAVRQATAADRVVVTKADLVPPSQVARVIQHVRSLNPFAEIVVAGTLEFRRSALFHAPSERRETWSSEEAPTHRSTYRTFALTIEQPLDWARFSLWLAALLNRHGRSLLRFKAILDLRGTSRPVVIHGVQHLMFPPRHLDRLPDGQRGSNLVFIVDAMDPERILRSLHRFMEQRAQPLAA